MAETRRGKAEAPDASAEPGGNIRAVLPYRDLREWLAEAERLGEVTALRGLDTEEEIGMAAELVMHSEEADCIVFDEIKGHEQGYRVLVNFFGGKRKNMTLGFPTDLGKVELSEACHAARLEKPEPIPHRVVTRGPVTENVLEGDAVDVGKFPAPLWHPDDGGRYIGAGSFSVTVDPDEGWINVGAGRVVVQDEKTVGYVASPGTHGRVHRDTYMARGEKMPTVVVLGGDPMTFLTAGAETPPGVCGYDIVGAMRGEPLEVVKGRHTGLPFPANAEIVLEGFVDLDERRPEGPFGEWTGYYGPGPRDEPVMRVAAIYHRDDPILLGRPPQRPPDEMCRYCAVTGSATLRDAIGRAGVPDVASAWAHEVGGSRLLLAVSIKQRYPGHARQAGHVAAMCDVGARAGRYVIVTDEDVDISNLDELTWAMITRSDPATSIDIIKSAGSTLLDPMIPPWEKKAGNMTNSRAIIDACRPFHWKDDFPIVNAPSQEVARKAREKFGYLLEGKDGP